MATSAVYVALSVVKAGVYFFLCVHDNIISANINEL